MQATVEKIESEVKQLSPQDLRKVRELVDSLLEMKEAKPQMTEEEFAQYLYEKGIIGKPSPPITDFSRYENYEPVKVEANLFPKQSSRSAGKWRLSFAIRARLSNAISPKQARLGF